MHAESDEPVSWRHRVPGARPSMHPSKIIRKISKNPWARTGELCQQKAKEKEPVASNSAWQNVRKIWMPNLKEKREGLDGARNAARWSAAGRPEPPRCGLGAPRRTHPSQPPLLRSRRAEACHRPKLQHTFQWVRENGVSGVTVRVAGAMG